MQGLVFDIQRFSLHDGPGIRTSVFLKGCPLRCPWCCNPESQRVRSEIFVNTGKCLQCGRCLEACEVGAISLVSSDGPKIDRNRCRGCGRCADACWSGALTKKGCAMSVREVVDVVVRDVEFYRQSNGGVTLTGGEPLAQPEFVIEVLRAIRRLNISTAIETSGCVRREALTQVAPLVNYFLFDVKHIDSECHRRVIGVGNEEILENLEALVRMKCDIVVRVPVIPGFNWEMDYLEALGRKVRHLGLREMHLLPYHRLGESKYSFLEREYPMWDAATPSDEELEKARRMLTDIGLSIAIYG